MSDLSQKSADDSKSRDSVRSKSGSPSKSRSRTKKKKNKTTGGDTNSQPVPVVDNGFVPAFLGVPETQMPGVPQEIPVLSLEAPASQRSMKTVSLRPATSLPIGSVSNIELQEEIMPLLGKRRCTDVFCCFIFLLFIFIWLIISGTAFKYGNPEALIYPSDSKGRVCGSQNQGKWNLTQRPYLYFFDLTRCISFSTGFKGCPTTQVCVDKCPTHYASYMELNLLQSELLPLTNVRRKLECTEEGWEDLEKGRNNDGLVLWETVKELVDDRQCTKYVVASKSIAGRCIPELIIKLGDEIGKLAETHKMNNITNDTDGSIPSADMLMNSKGFVRLLIKARAWGENLLIDFQHCWWQIVVMLIMTSVIAFTWIVLMRWIGGYMVWSSVILLTLLICGAAAFSWHKYFSVKSSDDDLNWKMTLNFASYFEMSTTWLVLGIISSIIAVVLILLVLFLRKRIVIAIAMIEESSKAVTHMPSCLFFPIAPFVLQLLILLFWLSVALNLQSWGLPICSLMEEDSALNATLEPLNFTECHCDKVGIDGCTFVQYQKGPSAKYFQALNMFGLFWTLIFLSAMCDLSLAGAFSSYYWAFRKPEDIPTLPVWRGMYRAIRYHTGSLAFGSFILATIKMIRVVLEYIHNKVKDAKNPVAECILTGCRCCFWFLEKIVKILTRNAYIMMAIYGHSFCKSAADSFALLLRNFVRVWVLDKTTDILLLIGKLLITAAMSALSYFYFHGGWMNNEFLVGNLNYYVMPIIIVTVGSYFITDAFFDVYEMAVDTTFLCFLEDSERNDGTALKPYYMTKKLMKILNKTNKEQEQQMDEKSTKNK